MKQKLVVSFLFLLVVLTVCFCHANPGKTPTSRRQNITIAGSTSVLPFTEKLSEHFMIENPNYVVDVQGGGSSAGIQACINHTVDVGMSSRDLKDAEKVLNEIIICYDGIGIIVNPKNSVRQITLDQVRAIYSGRIRNWKELGWIDRQIDAVTREEGSGTRGAFEDLVMKKEEISQAIMVQDSNGSVREVVTTDPYAIGYISLGMVDEKVRALTIDGVAPTVQSITKKTYRIARPFLYLTLGQPSSKAWSFIGFVLSEPGQEILRKEGLVAVHDF